MTCVEVNGLFSLLYFSNSQNNLILLGKSAPNCATCKDNPKRKCKECGCHECGGKENPEKQLMCDECDLPYHIYCLTPPMEAIPDVDEWFVHLLLCSF